MASTASTLFHLTSIPFPPMHPTYSTLHTLNPQRNANVVAHSSRRESLFLLTASTALTAVELKANAEDIPLFGLRKKLKKVEEEAVEIAKEGIETAEKGLEIAEKEIETVEKEIETVEKEIETAVAFGGVAQAGVVVGAEVVGVLVATSVVNGILGPEA